MSQNDASEDEARAIIAREKFMPPDDMCWDSKPSNAVYRVSSFNLTDASGITLPGLTAEFAYRTPAEFNDCKYYFSIYAFQPGGFRKRVYQLGVVPLEDRSSNHGGQTFYGPHEHIGTTVQEVRIGKLDCKDHEKWFREFLKRANIGYGGVYNGPFDGGGLFK